MVGNLPTWLDVHFLRVASAGLIVAAAVVALVVVMYVRSLGTRVLLVVLLAAAGLGLFHYRQTLERCDRGGCGCVLFGQRVEGAGCNR